jgi:hypothetical protein
MIYADRALRGRPRAWRFIFGGAEMNRTLVVVIALAVGILVGCARPQQPYTLERVRRFLRDTMPLPIRTQHDTERQGRYRIWICDSGCSSRDSTRATFIGDLVLHDEPVRWEELQAPYDNSLFNHYLFVFQRQGPPDACFEFTRPAIVTHLTRNLTHWRAVGDELVIGLYRSPDTWYGLHVTVRSDTLLGRTESGSSLQPAPRDRPGQVFGRRIGDADREVCVQLSRRLNERQ